MRAGETPGRVLLGLLLWVAASCAPPPRVYVNPQADMNFYRKVAVLPFTNLSQQGFAGERVTRAFITELIIADRYQVVEPGEFRAALERVGGEPNVEGHFDPEKLKEVAAKLEAAGIIRGAVSEYQVQRIGQDDFPVISFDVELLDAATSNVVWRASINRRGRGRVPVIGSSTRTLGRLTEEACQELVQGLRKVAF